jgi:methionine-rich copper-binding protein CopC
VGAYGGSDLAEHGADAMRRIMGTRFALWVVPAALAVTLVAATAGAHPKMVRSRPASNAHLTSPPSKIQVWFHEELDAKGSRLTVWNEQNEQVDRGDSKVSLDDRKLIEVGLKPLPPGRYTVKWRAMADDDKGVTQGKFAFTVGTPRK